MNVEEYLKDRVEDQIDWYDSKSMKNQWWFKRLRLAEISAAATIPLLAGHVGQDGPPLIPALLGILGIIVAVIAGVLGLYQFEHRWTQYRTTSETLKKEKFLFLTGSDPFDRTPDENYGLLVRRVENLVSEENTSWAQNMMKGSEGSDG